VITVIGNGNMAFAIVSKIVENSKVRVVGRDIDKLRDFTDRVGSNIEVSTLPTSIEGDTVILATKPNSIKGVSQVLSGKAENFISVLAGVDIQTLQNSFQSENYVRAMPNLSALFGESMTSLTGDKSGKEVAETIFSQVGSTIWFESEDEVDIATAIAGSGPAYLSVVAEALSDGGVKAGLKRSDSEKLVQGLFRGFPELLQHHKASDIKDGVMSPKGTTAHGYYALEKGGVRSTFMEAVERAYSRAVELRGASKK
jgi:pyrroline-5-carboxylate reductase